MYFVGFHEADFSYLPIHFIATFFPYCFIHLLLLLLLYAFIIKKLLLSTMITFSRLCRHRHCRRSRRRHRRRLCCQSVGISKLLTQAITLPTIEIYGKNCSNSI